MGVFMALGQRVKARREKLCMNQLELATAARIAQATISRVEAGEVEQLKSDALKRLAEALRVTVDYLVGRTDRLTSDDVVEADPQAKTIFRGYEKLSRSGQEQVAKFVRFLQQQERKDSK
jgi:transcriptional regulator with XRE-family HTH domain